MDANLTINSLSFVQKFSDRDAGSVRMETSRGVNLPEILTIKTQPYTDSKTKIPGRRTMVRIDRYVAGDAGDIISGLEAHVVLSVPERAEIETADVQACIVRLGTLLMGTTVTGGLDLKDEIFVNQEQ
jgi:hypothetical protein